MDLASLHFGPVTYVQWLPKPATSWMPYMSYALRATWSLRRRSEAMAGQARGRCTVVACRVICAVLLQMQSMGRAFSPLFFRDALPGALPAGWYEVAPLALPPSYRDCYGATLGRRVGALDLQGNVAGLLPTKSLMDNDVADVADVPTRSARMQVDG